MLRNPETIRRWIREGKLRAEKVGTQHLIDEDDLDAFVSDGVLPAPPHWDVMEDGSPMPPVEESSGASASRTRGPTTCRIAEIVGPTEL